MTLPEAQNLMTVIHRAFYHASKHIMDVYSRDFQVQYKEDSSPVTEADRGSNQIILEILKEAYPDYATLAEETYENDKENKARLEAPWCFIVDPLDGTKEFVAHIDQFSICIALAHHHKIEAGAVYSPTEDIMYYGVRGLGAYKINSQETSPRPEFFRPEDRIFVSKRRKKLIAMVSRYHTDAPTAALLERHKDRIAKVTTAGSALKGCRIAAGEADIYYRMGSTMEWDTAAYQVIVEEAGGIIRQMDPERSEFTYNRPDSLNANGFFVLNNIENNIIDDDFVIDVKK